MKIPSRKDPSHPYAADTRTSEELVAIHRQKVDSGEDDRKEMAIIHFRGGKTEYDIGKRLTESADPEDRCIGADILGQLGWSDITFLDETVDILIGLLNDRYPCVVNCAAVGLGHREDKRAIAPLVKLAEHDDSQVRFGVTFGLRGHDDERAVSALTKLCHDSDHDVRNWAMFGIGSCTDLDNAQIRDALVAGLDDPDLEISGEALVGLARRKDSRTYDAIIKAWELDTINILSIEAAEELADPKLLPRLTAFQESWDLSDGDIFAIALEHAISACRESGNADTDGELIPLSDPDAS